MSVASYAQPTSFLGVKHVPGEQSMAGMNSPGGSSLVSWWLGLRSTSVEESTQRRTPKRNLKALGLFDVQPCSILHCTIRYPTLSSCSHV